MIWHFFEVWLLLAIAFVVGCVLGAYLYGLVAASRLSLVQGAVADQVGDVVDRLKASLGLSPDWRPQHVRVVERPLRREDEGSDIDDGDLDDVSVAARAERDDPPFAESRSSTSLEQPRRWVVPVDDESDAPGISEPERLAIAGAVGDDGIVPMRPAGLAGPRSGVPDNLMRIRGVGERNEARLNSLGIYHFGQIAAWTPGEVRWIGQYLAFPERIERDNWVGQAMILASGGDTGFEKSSERRRRRRQERKQSSAAQQLAADVESIMGRKRSRPPASDTDNADDGDDD